MGQPVASFWDVTVRDFNAAYTGWCEANGVGSGRSGPVKSQDQQRLQSWLDELPNKRGSVRQQKPVRRGSIRGG